MADKKQARPENHKPYVSKPGFTKTPVLRGLTEITKLLQDIGGLGIICGGYVRYMASPHQKPAPASDVDVYPYDEDKYEALKTLFKQERGLQVRHENNMSITYKRPEEPEHPYFAAPAVQLIKPVVEGRVISVGSKQEILENFDFTVIRAGYAHGDGWATVDADFPHDEPRRILRLKNIHCPVSSTLRCMKYSRKGYWLPPMQALKLFIDWEGRTDEYRRRLYEYLQLANEGQGLTQEQVDELEELMRVD